MMIKKIAVAGCGIMGGGIAQCFAQKDYEVILYDIDKSMIDKSVDRIRFNQQTLIEHNIITKECAEKSTHRISTTTDIRDFSDCDFVIEAIVENLDIKKEFWNCVEAICSDYTIFSTNTSSLSINSVCSSLKNKSRFVGTNWWNPPHIIPLVEVTRCDETSDKTSQVVFSVLKDIGKEPVIINKEIEGFIGNRIQFAVFREALNLAEQGIASFEDIDRAIKFGIGFRYASLGPFETADLGGLDTFYTISDHLFKKLSDIKTPPEGLQKRFNEKKYGIKTGEGFFKYENQDEIERKLKKRDEQFLKTLKALKE